MKSILNILLIVFVLSACQNLQKQATKNLESGKSKITTNEYITKSGKKFVVEIDHSKGASICDVKVETLEFSVDNRTFDLGTIDPVKEVFLTDLDKNGFEEIYLISESAGSGSYQTIYGIASNKDKSAKSIYIPPVSEIKNKNIFAGFMGHNKFFLNEGKLLNLFPVYQEGDSNSNPSGGERKIQYQLISGEAGWIVEPYKIIE